jgi:hypothetical protein
VLWSPTPPGAGPGPEPASAMSHEPRVMKPQALSIKHQVSSIEYQ